MFTDPSFFNYTVNRGATHLNSGLTNYVKWQDQMIKEFGDTIRPHLLKIWAQAKQKEKEETQEELGRKAIAENDKLRRYDELNKKLTDPARSVNDNKQYENIESEKKDIKKNRRIELILFVGGTFLFMVNLTGGYYSRGGSDFLGGYSSSSGFRWWANLGMAIGISMIVYGFLRKSWRKKR